MKTIIQNFIYPGLNFQNPEDMYLRGCYLLDRSNQTVRIFKGNSTSFDTYFNALSVYTWKKDCSLDNLYFGIAGEGECIVELCYRFKDEIPLVLKSFNVKLKSQKQYFSIEDWSRIESGFLFLRINGLSDCIVTSLEFASDTEVNAQTRLGIVITHFNRQQSVSKTIDRIEHTLLNRYPDSNIELIIVDNSSNLNIKTGNSKITILPSKNLGGAGGFTRGLIYLKERGFTHCCFMDDDASCEVESIRRTFVYFSYISKDNRRDVAISGTLLKEEEPNIILEAGAIFHRGRWMPTSHNLNVSSFESLYWLEYENLRSNYGAWCYFAFDIGNVKHYAYPFFVRGDDIFFSIINQFKVKTINGVCTWVDNFVLKDSPLTRYLQFRAMAIIPMLQGNSSMSRFIKNFYNWHSDCLHKYNYASAEAIEIAVSDIIGGSRFIEEDVDGAILRKKLKPLMDLEKLTVRPEEVNFQDPDKKKSYFKEILRVITVNGLFVPSILFKKNVIQMKETNGDRRDIFLKKGVYYYNKYSRLGCLVEYNKFESIKRICSRSLLIGKIVFKYRKFSKDFNQSGRLFTTSSFWNNVFSDSCK